jgi:Domain of unknown function (DUF3854)
MGDSRYKRATRREPCRICGKPDWCSRTADEKISFCARVTDGADRLSRKEGWGVFYHDREMLENPRGFHDEPKNRFKPVEEIPSAPLEIRDFVYRTLLRLSPASSYAEIIHGAKGLVERGLDNSGDYGSLPCSLGERRDLAARLRLLLNQTFPDFVRENPLGLRHVPGFWTDKTGAACLWQSRDFGKPMLLVPYRSPTGKIQACQIRFTGTIKPTEKRYLWLSLPKLNSAGCGTPLHYAAWKTFGTANSNKPILVTEGALKADIVTSLRPDFFAVATGGVSCAHELLVNVSHGRPVYLAFDSDSRENPAVARQLAKLVKLRLQTSKNQAETKILTWTESEKGVDDALLKGENLREISFREWLSALGEKCLEEVRKVWFEQ